MGGEAWGVVQDLALRDVPPGCFQEDPAEIFSPTSADVGGCS